MPKGIYDRASSKWKPRPKKTYDPELVEMVRRTYEAGHTMAETADICGTTVKVLQRLMPRHGINRRPAVIRNQNGPNNANWKGDKALYAALHLRVRSARGEPSGCRCGAAGCAYEWANLTGDYCNVDDYESMCVSCHRRYDIKRRRETGQPTMGQYGGLPE